MAYSFPALIGDIGGTNARFSVILDAHSGAIEFDPTRLADHASIEDAIQAAVLDKTTHWPKTMVLAIAAPLAGRDSFPLTNASFEINPDKLIEYFDLDQLVVMNDFAAQALAALTVDEGDMITFGAGEEVDDAPKSVLGPGTGLGIANMVKANGSWVILSGEGGHIDLGPRTQREFAIWPYLESVNGRISAEQVICGRGLENVYRAICKADGTGTQGNLRDHEITARALAGSDNTAFEACQLLITMLGRVAGDMALLTLARGGVYLAGGIASKLAEMISGGGFRAAMEDKAPHNAILRQVPSKVITHPKAALVGLCAYVQTPELYVMDQAVRVFSPTISN